MEEKKQKNSMLKTTLKHLKELKKRKELSSDKRKTLLSILKDSASRGRVKHLKYQKNRVKITICFISKRNKMQMEKILKIFGM